MNLWILILIAGLGTYLTRLSFIAAHGHFEMPEWFTRALAFVPVAVLSAIIAPELLAPGGVQNFAFTNVRLIAGVAATLVAWRTRNVWLTIAVGMVALLGLQAVM